MEVELDVELVVEARAGRCRPSHEPGARDYGSARNAAPCGAELRTAHAIGMAAMASTQPAGATQAKAARARRSLSRNEDRDPVFPRVRTRSAGNSDSFRTRRV